MHTAKMDEPVQGVKDLTKEFGNNNSPEVQGGAAREVFSESVSRHSLHRAAAHRNVQSMKELLSAGADTEMRDEQGRTPLHLVLTSCPSDPAPGAETNSKFHRAVIGMRQQAETCMQLLCDHGADVNANMVERNHHQSALHLSVCYRSLAAVHILASCGADVNAVDSCGMTPLHRAAAMLHQGITVSLIRHGAVVNKGIQHTENTPLHQATVAIAVKPNRADSMSCISELLQHGADPNKVNTAGLSPLHEAVSMGAEEVVDLLLQHGADIDKCSDAGESCVFLFLNRGTNVRNDSLWVKLLSLSSPITVYNPKGQLPSTLMQPRFSRQRDRLLEVTQQPWRLQDICKRDIYLKHVQGRRETARKVLPEKLYNFVFNQWDNIHNISFEADCEQEPLDSLLNMSLT